MILYISDNDSAIRLGNFVGEKKNLKALLKTLVQKSTQNISSFFFMTTQ